MQAASAGFATVMSGQAMTVDHQVEVFLPYRTNLCPTPNFTHGTRGSWVQYNGSLTIAEVAPPTAPPANPAEATVGRITWSTGGVETGLLMTSFATVPGVTYTISRYAYMPSSSLTGVQLTAFGIGGVGSVSTYNAWQRMSYTFVAVNNSTTIGFVNNASSTSGQITYVTDFLFEQASSLGAYFDGDMANGRWTSTADASTSQLNLLAVNDASLTVQSIDVDRETTTDMPVQTRLVAGYPAASGTFVLAGSLSATDVTQQITSLFNPYNTAGLLYRGDSTLCEVRSAAGVYNANSGNLAELIPQFGGIVDDMEFDPIAGTITLNCIDFRNKLRTAPSIPSFSAIPVPNSDYDSTPMLTAGYGLDFILRNAGIYSSPPPRPGCIFYQSLHGSLWPEINGGAVTATPINLTGGVITTANDVSANFAPGNWTQEAVAGMFITSGKLATPYKIAANRVGIAGQGLYAELTGYFDPSTTNGYTEIDIGHALSVGGPITSEYRVNVQTTSSGTLHIFASYGPYNGSGAGTVQSLAVTPTITAGQHTIGVSFVWVSATVLRIDIYTDWTTQNTTDLTYASGHTTAPYTTIDSAITVSTSTNTTENIQITNEIVGNTYLSTHFTAAAVLDASLNQNLSALPDVTGQDEWQVIQQIMDAEQGVAGFDESTVFRFYNRNTMRGRTSSKTLDSEINLKTLQLGMQSSTVYTHVQVPVNELTLSPAAAIWSSNSVIAVPANNSITLLANLSAASAANSLAATDSGVAPNGGGTPGLTYWRGALGIDGTGGIVSSGISVFVEQISPTVLSIQITNALSAVVYLVTPAGAGYTDAAAGAPALTVGGQSITAVANPVGLTSEIAAGTIADVQWPPLSEGGAVLNPRGDILLPIPANPWQQDYTTALAFAWDVLGDLYHPLPIFTNVDAVLDPRVQVTDRQTFNAPEYSINGDVRVSGVHSKIDNGNWDMTLTLRAIAMPGDWILGDPAFSQLGSTTIV